MKCIVILICLTTQLEYSVIKTAQVLYQEVIRRPIDTLQLALPAFLYTLQENLVIYALAILDTATYQVVAFIL